MPALIEAIERARGWNDGGAQLLFVDCAADVLLRRFSETRRRHPSARDETPRIGMELIDTSDLSPHDLRARLAEWFANDAQNTLSVMVQSFAFKRGTPGGLDMMMDLDEAVGRYIKEDPLYQPFLAQLTEITNLLLPAYKAEGKSYFSLGLGCTGGQHRSVFVAGVFANALAEKGWQVSIRHRELERGERLGRSRPGTGVV